MIRASLLFSFLTFIFGLIGCSSSTPPLNTSDFSKNDSSIIDTIPPTDLIPKVDAPECVKNEDCNGGICVEGSCCPTAEQVCGQVCCESGAICFANACVTPGSPCFVKEDCADDEYCEPSLGDNASTNSDAGLSDAGINDAGTSDASSGSVCLNPPPSEGRCLKLPEKCDDTNPQPGCLPSCEYHPSVKNLTVTTKWHWGEGTVKSFVNHVDVWSTPVVGRLTDTNCDGKVNQLDPPNIIFISGDAKGSQCAAGSVLQCNKGVLRVLDGASGQEIWSMDKVDPQSAGFTAMSIALGDITRDGHLEIVAVTGEAYVVIIDRTGTVIYTSDQPIPDAFNSGVIRNNFGWGGGLAIADMNGDGFAEIAYGRSVFTTKDNALTLLFTGTHGMGGAHGRSLSIFADLDGDGQEELVVGNAAYKYDGTDLWYNSTLYDGYPAVADFDGDGKPEVATIYSGNLRIVEGATGNLIVGPFALTGTKNGGPPTVADFDGDGKAEVGVAMADYYSVVDVELGATDPAQKLVELWHQINHDFSSSVTGSTVFDFEGDGKAEVIYNDECFLWVYDGTDGSVRFATPTTSFTATEASLVADVDGDGRAEMVMIANRASPTSWKCNIEPWITADPTRNRPAWVPPANYSAYSGITVFGDSENSWVGTRKIWNQHSYHVSNICDGRDDACQSSENTYGAIPRFKKPNWKVNWLNNFRQNVQGEGLFDAPDPTVSLRIACVSESQVEGVVRLYATLRNMGFALLPAGVEVGIYVQESGGDRLIYSEKSKTMLFPGQAIEIPYTTIPADNVLQTDTFIAKIIVDPQNPTFNECRPENNESDPTTNPCIIR